MNENKLKIISYPPFIHSNDTIQKAMLDVIISLIPVILASIYFFKLYAINLFLINIFFSIFFEYIACKIMKKKKSIEDLSCVVTAILFTLTLPPTTPIFISILGIFIAIILAKNIYGGIGCNFFNPALVGRCFVFISFSSQLTTWINPINNSFNNLTIATATPLNNIKNISSILFTNEINNGNILLNNIIFSDSNIIWKLISGNIPGSLGETSILALIIGGIYLIIKKRINIEIPVIYINTCLLISLIICLFNNLNFNYALLHIFSGGLFLGAIFMATDWVTTPITKKGRIIFSIGLGIFTMLIRLKSNYPEGVLFAILLMNMLVPLIDKYSSNIHYKKKVLKKQ